MKQNHHGRFYNLYQKQKKLSFRSQVTYKIYSISYFFYTLFSVGCFGDVAKNQVTAVHVWYFKSNRLQNKFQNTDFVHFISLPSVTYCIQCLIKKYVELRQSRRFNPEKYAYQDHFFYIPK